MVNLMVVWQGRRREEFGVLKGHNISVGSDRGNMIVIPSGEGVPLSHELFHYDQRSMRWKLRLLPSFEGHLRHRGGGRKVPLACVVRSGHLKQDGESRVFTLYTHQLSGRMTIGGTEIRFYFSLSNSRVARPPRHLTEERAQG